MPAYFDTGFSVRQPMWHGGGLVLDEYPTDWNDARDKADLLWEPRAVPTFQQLIVAIDDVNDTDVVLGEAEHAGQVRIFRPLSDHKLIERDDTEAVLGVVGDGFELVQHDEMGEIIESILGVEPGLVKFETAGSCRGGAQVWALAYLDEPYRVPGDQSDTYPFLALLNAHDGSGACKLVRTQVRVVCWNTYRAAEMEGQRTGMQFSFRHTATVHERLDEAKQALSGLRDEAKAWNELATDLFGMPADEVAFNHFLADFIPEPVEDIVSPRVRDNVETARRIFKSMYLDSPTSDAHRGTALGLVDTAVEYLDHVRGFRNQDTYLGRTLLRPEPLKAKAVLLARQACSA
jgi:phage/plasmid-like protein (TIGR03299 family)